MFIVKRLLLIEFNTNFVKLFIKMLYFYLSSLEHVLHKPKEGYSFIVLTGRIVFSTIKICSPIKEKEPCSFNSRSVIGTQINMADVMWKVSKMRTDETNMKPWCTTVANGCVFKIFLQLNYHGGNAVFIALGTMLSLACLNLDEGTGTASENICCSLTIIPFRSIINKILWLTFVASIRNFYY